ncbi:MAG: UDP-N-acetylmuramate dehydrogenase [Streptosporangiaceae bacterium]
MRTRADVVEDAPLAPYTTLRLGGPARRMVEASTQQEIVDAVAAADRVDEPVVILGGGSNVVAADAGFPGTVVRVVARGVELARDPDGAARLTAQAGEDWDPLVARCVDERLPGVECLSGIPGLVGAAPIQNVGAYGQEVSETVASVRVYDRRAGAVAQLDPADCGFGYRTSVFKSTGRYVVLEMTLTLESGAYARPVRYAELARTLGVAVGERAPLRAVREAVLGLRRRKGMVLDPDDPDTTSAGSFFTNPVLDPAGVAGLERRAPGFPRYPAAGRTKVPAAWLIEHAGFDRGYTKGSVRISTKHTLALTNPDGRGTTAELLALAREVRDGVREKFGVELVNEPVLLGACL